jgi:hypothetical protein
LKSAVSVTTQEQVNIIIIRIISSCGVNIFVFFLVSGHVDRVKKTEVDKQIGVNQNNAYIIVLFVV